MLLVADCRDNVDQEVCRKNIEEDHKHRVFKAFDQKGEYLSHRKWMACLKCL